jgi:hypothetical protein
MMRSIRARLLLGLLLLVAVMSLMVGSITYRRVLGETSDLFDYQLRQMALTLGDQASVLSGYPLPPQSENSDFVIQIWDIFGTRLFSPELPFVTNAVLGYSDLTFQNERWRVYVLANRTSVIQVAQPWSVREKLAREAAVRIVVPLLILLALMAVAAAWIVSNIATSTASRRWPRPIFLPKSRPWSRNSTACWSGSPVPLPVNGRSSPTPPTSCVRR